MANSGHKASNRSITATPGGGERLSWAAAQGNARRRRDDGGTSGRLPVWCTALAGRCAVDGYRALPLLDLPTQQRRHSHHLGHGAAPGISLAVRHAEGVRLISQLHALFLRGLRCTSGAAHFAQPGYAGCNRRHTGRAGASPGGSAYLGGQPAALVDGRSAIAGRAAGRDRLGSST